MVTANTILAEAKILVIKVGSNFLVDAKGETNRESIARLARDIGELKHKSKPSSKMDIILVASGAVAAGIAHSGGKRTETDRKAAAALGQVRLLSTIATEFSRISLSIAQVLLNFEDTEDRHRFLQARSMLRRLLDLGHIPVINENDSVGVQASGYGDNDRLAARVATMVGAQLLILLSDIDGLYDMDPSKNPKANLLKLVDHIDDSHRKMAKSAPAGNTSGGMKTKIEAAQIATLANCQVIIARADVKQPLMQFKDPKTNCTIFTSEKTSSVRARKSWIGGTLRPKGSLTLDGGAATAIVSGKSLLPAGITKVQGEFKRQDAVDLLNEEGYKLAVGLINYSNNECQQLIGVKSNELEKLFGKNVPHEVVHRDNMAVMLRPKTH